MQGNVGLVPYDPGVVPGRNIENLSCAHLNDVTVTHGGGCAAGYDHTDMFDHTFFLLQRFANVFGPTPSRVISGAAYGHAAQMDNFKFSLLEGADFVRRFKPFQNYFGH